MLRRALTSQLDTPRARSHLSTRRDGPRKRLLSMPAKQRARVLRQCGDWRHTVRHVLINDMAPDRYGKRFHCHSPAMLDSALDRLSRIAGWSDLTDQVFFTNKAPVVVAV